MNKKILKILSLALAAAIAVSVSACSSHEHDVSKWTTLTEATCTTPGVEQGICATCGDTVTRETEIDPDNHTYGEWNITKMPTESASGTAIKICSECGDERMAMLPELSSNEYTTSVTTRPTATTNGVRSYSYYHELGNIEFTTTISSSGITSVRDAVEVGCDDVSHALVRSGTGTVISEYYEYGNSPSNNPQPYKFSYEYSDDNDYTYINNVESDKRERWYSIDSDGNIFGYCHDTTSGDSYYEETQTANGSDDYIYGYRYIFVWATYVGTYYGTENFVLGLYNAAKQNNNGDFDEKVTELTSGETQYYFTYGMYQIIGNSGGYYSVVEVTFTLTDEYTIKSLDATCTTYVNGSDDDSKTWELREVNGEKYAVVISGTGTRYVDNFTVEQVTKSEDPEDPVNPYPASAMRISSYNIVYNNNIDSSGNYVGEGTIVGEKDDDTVITITARAATQSSYTYKDSDTDVGESGNVTATKNHFYLTGILPSNMETNAATDLTFYYRKYTNSDKTAYTDYEINSTSATDSSSSVGVACTFNSRDNSFFILSKISGYVDIVIKTYNTEKVIHFYVTPIAPSTLYPMIYQYSTTGYDWSSSYSTSVSASVYVGQNLYFKSDVPATEVNFADYEYTVSVTSAVGTGGNIISSEYYTLTNQYDEGNDFTFNGQSMSTFSAKRAGTYTLTLVSVRDSSVKSTIVVTVKDIPDNSQLFSASYATVLSYAPKGNVTITFEAGESEGEYFATIVSSEGEEVLKCYYNGVTLTSEHYSGTESGFTLTFNEAYDLVISHSTGYHDMDDEGNYLDTYIMETVVLTKS